MISRREVTVAISQRPLVWFLKTTCVWWPQWRWIWNHNVNSCLLQRKLWKLKANCVVGSSKFVADKQGNRFVTRSCADISDTRTTKECVPTYHIVRSLSSRNQFPPKSPTGWLCRERSKRLFVNSLYFMEAGLRIATYHSPRFEVSASREIQIYLLKW